MPKKGKMQKESRKVRVVVSQPAPRRQPRRSSGRKARAQTAMFGVTPQNRYREPSAPLAPSRRIPTVGLSMSDQAQKLSDQGNCPSVRVSGTDIMNTVLGAKAGTTDALTATTSIGASIPFGPLEVSVRLSQLAGMYSWYAFRELEFIFIPMVSPVSLSSTTSVGAAELVAVCFDTDASAVSADGPTNFQTVTQVDPSVAFPAWEGGSFRYRFNGTKLWATSTGNAQTGKVDCYQGSLAAKWNNTPQPTNIVQTHAIYVRYVMDLYRPQEITYYPTQPKPQSLRSLRTEFDKLARQLAQAEADEFKVSEDGDIVAIPSSAPASARTIRTR